MKLLVADGNVFERDELIKCFEGQTDVEILPPVEDGQSVLDVLSTQRVDILLMDTILPKLDGLAVLAKMRQIDMIKRPMVFITSIFVTENLLFEFQKYGVIYCFAKPVSAMNVMSQVIRFANIPTRKERDAYIYEQYLPYASKTRLREEITKQIRAIGVPAHLKGYHYLRTAIQLLVESDEPSNVAITKDVYPLVAQECGTRAMLVERAIRNAIEVAWIRGDTKVIYEYFGYTVNDKKGKPTNAEFIAMIADRVRMKFTK